MKYFILKNSTGKDRGDVLALQINSRVIEGYDYADEKSYQFLPNLNVPKITPDMGALIVEPKALMTDFISCMGIIPATGFIVNEKVKQLFSQFDMMRHFFYPTELLHKKKVYEYYWLHLADDFLYYIDFDNSSFITKRPAIWDIPGWDEKIQPAQIDSPETMLAIKKELKTVRAISPIKLCLRHKPLDLFAFSCFSQEKVIISEKLKNEILQIRISGIEMEEITFPIVFT